MDKLFYPVRLTGCAAAPASKSEAHRRMICAGLSSEPTVLAGYTPSADLKATLKCIKALGAQVAVEGDKVTLQAGHRLGFMLPLMDCGESGSTLRFFVPIAMALTGGGVFRMHGRLSQRPMDVYLPPFSSAVIMFRSPSHQPTQNHSFSFCCSFFA